MAKKILITSALLYANGSLHFGHLAGAYLPGDVYARFQRLKGNDVVYISGSDEYGIAITLSAEMAGRSPKEHVDLYHEINKNLFEQLDFSFDHYARTTNEGHKENTIAFFQDLLKNGYIEAKEEKHLFSKEENRFLSDRYVVGTCPKCNYENARGDECPHCGASYDAIELKSPRSKLKNTPLTLKPSIHWYLRFDLFKDKLTEWINTKSWKENVVRFAKNYIDDLRPRPITRDSRWGIDVPLPEAKDKVFYVWFDAPIGYISATREWAEKRGDKDLWKSYWQDPEAKLIQFIGKDNIPFHTVFFPAMIMGQNQPYKLPDEVPANEFLMLEGRQFSKSDNWYIDLQEFLKKFSSDQIRYALAANAPETADADFNFKDFQMRCNAELMGKFGNLAHRTLTFAKMHCGGVIPDLHSLSQDDQVFLEEIKLSVNEASNAYENFRLRKATSSIMELCQKANTYFDFKKPWVLAKIPEKKNEMQSTIGVLLEALKLLAMISSPITTKASQRLWEFLGYKTLISKQNWEQVLSNTNPHGQLLPTPEILFPKVEDEVIEQELAKLGEKKGEKAISYIPLKENITFDDFSKADLRVAQVISCVKVVKSKKLLKLEVDLGFEKRVIVSGIAESIEPESIVGKKILIVANIPPVKILGIESQGMVLAAFHGHSFELPGIEGLPVGSVVS